jgi:hypothetical protein
MYLNLALITEKGYNLQEVFVMQLLKQNRSEDLEEYLAYYLSDPIIERFEKENILTSIKKKKKNDSGFSTIRLSKKGDKLLSEFTDTCLVEDQDIMVFDWVKNMYLGLGKEIGSETKCKNLISWFRRESGISKNNLVILIRDFVSDDDRMEYSKVMQYVFWKGENHFQTKPKLEDSKLWLYYEKYREVFDNKKFEE